MGARPELPFELGASGIIAVLRTRQPEFLPVLVGYLWDAGVGAVELPVDIPDCLLAIAALSATPATVGVGEVVDVVQADAVIDAGARFVSCPIGTHSVVRRCAERGVAAIALAGPDDVVTAWSESAAAVKLDCGRVGPSLIRDVARAVPGILLVASGGIDDRSAADYIRAGARAVVADDWLLGDAADAGSLEAFGQRARRLVAAVVAAT